MTSGRKPFRRQTFGRLTKLKKTIINTSTFEQTMESKLCRPNITSIKVSVYQMSVDQMVVDQTVVDQMVVDQKTWDQNIDLKGRYNYFLQLSKILTIPTLFSSFLSSQKQRTMHLEGTLTLKMNLKYIDLSYGYALPPIL